MTPIEYFRLTPVQQKNYLAEHFEHWLATTELLLRLGGTQVELLPPPSDDWLSRLNDRYSVSKGYANVLNKSRHVDPTDIHGSALRLYLHDMLDALYSGFALTSEGIWRLHTWPVTNDNVIEVTPIRRNCYVGFALTYPDEVKEFQRWAEPKSIWGLLGDPFEQYVKLPKLPLPQPTSNG